MKVLLWNNFILPNSFLFDEQEFLKKMIMNYSTYLLLLLEIIINYISSIYILHFIKYLHHLVLVFLFIFFMCPSTEHQICLCKNEKKICVYVNIFNDKFNFNVIYKIALLTEKIFLLFYIYFSFIQIDLYQKNVKCF